MTTPPGSASTETATTRILIVDDHPLIRTALRTLFELEGDLEVCAEAEDVEEALTAVRECRPHLVLVDLSLRRSHGLDLIKRLRSEHPDVLMLAVSMHDEFTYATRVLRAGANGYIMKAEGNGNVLAAVRTVLSGRTFLSEAMTRAAVDQLGKGLTPHAAPVDVLSDRELQLFELTGHGKEIAEIAAIMAISPRTVEVHRSHIKKKLQLKSGTDIFQRAYEWLREMGVQP
ncbi:MAG: response regulator transcription factor [Candidatus Krumholzibacteriia bacterium]